MKHEYVNYDKIKNDISRVYTNPKNKHFVNFDEIKALISENEFFKNSTFIDPKNRNKVINDLTKYFKNLKDSDGKRIEVEGDHVIQIGSVFHRYGEKEPYRRHIVVYKEGAKKPKDVCDKLDEFNIDVDRCFTEKDLFLNGLKLYKKKIQITLLVIISLVLILILSLKELKSCFQEKKINFIN